jgi:Cu+-exporting ATPase
MRAMTSAPHAAHGHAQTPAAPAPAAAKAKDPVCGMSVDPATSKHRTEHAGTTYYFCCAGCRTKFEADPAHYLAKAAAASKATDPVCGMSVDIATAKHKAEHGGRTQYFFTDETLFLTENAFPVNPLGRFFFIGLDANF